MIPNFDNGNALMTTSYGFQPNSYGDNGLPYNGMASPQNEDKEKSLKFAANNKIEYHHNANFKDTNPFFPATFQPSFQRFGQFGIGGSGYFPSPYMPCFYDRMHEMEARIPLEYARVWLDHQTLWRRFSVCGNEMIITKMGR